MPDDFKISINTAATFMARRISLRPRRRRRGPEREVLRVDRVADRRRRLAFRLETHHVTRDVQTERSGGGVAGERDLFAPLGFHVAGAIGGVAEPLAAAGARDDREGVPVLEREGVELPRVCLRGKDRELAASDRLVLVADRIDSYRLRGGRQPPRDSAHYECQSEDDDERPHHGPLSRRYSWPPRRSVPRPLASS